MKRSLMSKILRASALATAASLCSAAWADGDDDELRRGVVVQWLLSIPAAVNPAADASGANCMVGQRGSSWYIVAPFGGGTANLNCSVPQGVKLVVLVAGISNVDTPGACGQGASISVAETRAFLSSYTDTLTASATLDGVKLKLRRVKSEVFTTTLPALNAFDLFCGGPGTMPAGVYPRSLDDSYYAETERLKPGTHTLHLVASNGSSFNQNVVYTLTVVPRDPR